MFIQKKSAHKGGKRCKRNKNEKTRLHGLPTFAGLLSTKSS
jgi:hypothetical protein